MNASKNEIVGARLSIQRALLGEVASALRAVTFSNDERTMEVRFYFDGPISAVDIESASCVETEILADYEDEDTVKVRCIRLDAPNPVDDEGILVYQRRETLT